MSLKLNLNTRDTEFDENKHFIIADKTQDIKQRLTLKIELIKGEWYLNKNEGIDWKKAFEKTGTEQENFVKNEILKVLKNDKAVIEVKELVVKQDINTANLNVNFTVLCTDSKEYTIKIVKQG